MRTREKHVPVLLLPIIIAGFASGGLAIAAAATQEPAVAPEAPPAPELNAATAAAQSQSRIVTGDRTIEEGESVEEIVVMGGDLRVRGEVTGDAVVVGGDLILEDSGVILGDAMVTGGELIDQGGRVRGEMRSVQGPGLNLSVETAEGGGTAATPTAEGARDRARNASQSRSNNNDFGFGAIRRGIAGIISTLAFGLVLAGIGAALVFYARPYLETVSDTVRGATLRSAGTGLAATFLAVPAFVVLIVALAVSIVGIPFLLLAVPLYPVALFAAGVFGLLAVSHAIGERTAEQSRDALDLRYRNSYAYLFTGLGMLVLPHLAAHLISMTGFLGFVGTLLRVVTWIAIWAAATVGFGAVILSRAGRRRTFVAMPPEVATYDADDLFADETIGG